MTRLKLLLSAVAGILLLAACAGKPLPEPDQGSFTIAVSPASLDVRRLEAADIRVTVQRSGDFAGPVVLGVAGAVDGLTFPEVTVTGEQAELRIGVQAAAATGARVLTVTGTSGETVRTDQFSLSVLEAAGTPVSAVLDDGGPVTSVRQGAGNLTLTVTGTNLMLVTGYSLGSLAFAELPGRTATQMQLTVAVAHGAQVGVHDLVLTSGPVEVSLPAVVEVTPITAAVTGSDASGRGTSGSPFRSLTRALSVAAAGDQVLLNPGSYTAAAGEVWPLLAGTPNVPPGVSILAPGARLEGPGVASGTAGLMFLAGPVTQVTGLSVSGFEAGFLLNQAGAAVELLETSASGNAIGAQVQGGTLDVADGAFTGGGIGLATSGSSQVRLSGVEVTDNSASGIDVQGGMASLDVTGSFLQRNGMAGLWFDGGNLKLRATEASSNAEFGIYVTGEPARIDLGTLTEAGNNSIHGNGPNGTGNQLLDLRPPRATLGVPVIFTISATTFADGTEAVPDVYVGPHVDPPQITILGANNTVQVF